MGFYNADRQDTGVRAEVRESSRYAVPLLLAYAQIGLVAWGIGILIAGQAPEHRNDFFVLGVFWPMSLAGFLAPLTLLSGVYYFFRYRHDPAPKRLAVIIGMVLSLFAGGIVAKLLA